MVTIPGHISVDTSNAFYGQPLSRPNPEAGHLYKIIIMEDKNRPESNFAGHDNPP